HATRIPTPIIPAPASLGSTQSALPLLFFRAPAPSAIYPLSLHDALPISIGGTAVGTGINAHPRFGARVVQLLSERCGTALEESPDRKSTRLNSSHVKSSYAVFCLKKKNQHRHIVNRRSDT